MEHTTFLRLGEKWKSKKKINFLLRLCVPLFCVCVISSNNENFDKIQKCVKMLLIFAKLEINLTGQIMALAGYDNFENRKSLNFFYFQNVN